MKKESHKLHAKAYRQFPARRTTRHSPCIPKYLQPDQELYRRTSIKNQRAYPLVAKSFPKLPVVLPTSVEYHFHLHENVSCRIFSCRRRKAHNGISPPVPLCLHRNTRNGKTSCRHSDTAASLQPTNTSKYKNGKARKLFLLLFMLRGIPFVDIAYLRDAI